jgi:hypothetical protein
MQPTNPFLVNISMDYTDISAQSPVFCIIYKNRDYSLLCLTLLCYLILILIFILNLYFNMLLNKGNLFIEY